jgi:hypothetical protein
MRIGERAEIFERALIALLHSVTIGIHAAKFPGHPNIAVTSCVLSVFCAALISPIYRARNHARKLAEYIAFGRDLANRRSGIRRASGAI